MSKRILITLCASLLLTACGGDKPADDKKATDKKVDDGPKPAGDSGAVAPEPEPTPPPTAAKIDLKALKVDAAGWEGEYNAALEGWTFEKYTPNAEGDSDPNRFYIDYIDTDRTGDLEEYAKKLQEDPMFQDLGYLYTSIDKKEKLDNGWLITGVMKDQGDPEDEGEPSFVIYRTDKGIYCRSGAFVDAKIRDEALEACKKL